MLAMLLDDSNALGFGAREEYASAVHEGKRDPFGSLGRTVTNDIFSRTAVQTSGIEGDHEKRGDHFLNFEGIVRSSGDEIESIGEAVDDILPRAASGNRRDFFSKLKDSVDKFGKAVTDKLFPRAAAPASGIESGVQEEKRDVSSKFKASIGKIGKDLIDVLFARAPAPASGAEIGDEIEISSFAGTANANVGRSVGSRRLDSRASGAMSVGHSGGKAQGISAGNSGASGAASAGHSKVNTRDISAGGFEDSSAGDDGDS
ncbi:hypothetical protein FGG08_002261 [Glutinoglossum americanum]|uniref:Uncharacterized protein n=1 Tax=Glutinoglossum americanum TaxID=1670608 RepID=A0A9P8I9Y6_9PEZI|nr:hypothetical protein FGG08_002261 [Glutinoglossum americanum]